MRDPRVPDEVREAAVFALSQLPKEQAVELPESLWVLVPIYTAGEAVTLTTLPTAS